MGVRFGRSVNAALIEFETVEDAQAFARAPFAPNAVRDKTVTDIQYAPTLLEHGDKWVLAWQYSHTAQNSGDWGGNTRRFIRQAAARAGVTYRIIEIKEVDRDESITPLRRRRFVSHASPIARQSHEMQFDIDVDLRIRIKVA